MRNKGIRIEYERWVAKKVRKVCTLDRLVLDAEEGEERERLEEEAPRLVSTMVVAVVTAKRDERGNNRLRPRNRRMICESDHANVVKICVLVFL